MILNLGLHLNKSSPYLVIFSYLKKHLSLTVDKSLVIDLCQLFIFFLCFSLSPARSGHPEQAAESAHRQGNPSLAAIIFAEMDPNSNRKKLMKNEGLPVVR